MGFLKLRCKVSIRCNVSRWTKPSLNIACWVLFICSGLNGLTCTAHWHLIPLTYLHECHVVNLNTVRMSLLICIKLIFFTRNVHYQSFLLWISLSYLDYQYDDVYSQTVCLCWKLKNSDFEEIMFWKRCNFFCGLVMVKTKHIHAKPGFVLGWNISLKFPVIVSATIYFTALSKHWTSRIGWSHGRINHLGT